MNQMSGYLLTVTNRTVQTRPKVFLPPTQNHR